MFRFCLSSLPTKVPLFSVTGTDVFAFTEPLYHLPLSRSQGWNLGQKFMHTFTSHGSPGLDRLVVFRCCCKIKITRCHPPLPSVLRLRVCQWWWWCGWCPPVGVADASSAETMKREGKGNARRHKKVGVVLFCPIRYSI